MIEKDIIERAKALEVRPEDVTVLIPVLNEEGAIQKVLREVTESGFENIIVVDGGSTDRTGDLAREEGVLIISQRGSGKSDAIRTAVPYIPTPYTLIMDGDNTYDPSDIYKLLKEGGMNDEVIGDRIRGGGKENIPALHRFGNWVITTVFNVLFGTSLHDVCSGMYLVKTEFLREYDFNARGFGVEAGIAAHVSSVSRRIYEVPINYRERIGEPKLKSRAGIGIVLDSVKLAWIYNPVFLIFLLASLIIVPSSVLLAFVAYRYLVYGISHFVWAIIGVVGLGIGIVSLLQALMCLYMKHIEYRLYSRLKNGHQDGSRKR